MTLRTPRVRRRPTRRPEDRTQLGLARLRRRWWIPVLVALVVTGAVYGVERSAGTSYVGRSALELISTGNSPGEEAVAAQGYADYFNQTTTQQLLRDRAGVAASVGLGAHVAADSPILYIEATTSDPQQATEAAGKIATAFHDQVQRSLAAAAPQPLPVPASASGSDSGSDPSLTTLNVLRLDGGTESIHPSPSRDMETYGLFAALFGVWLAVSIPERRPRSATRPEPTGEDVAHADGSSSR